MKDEASDNDVTKLKEVLESKWSPWNGELDENNCLAYGEFKICTTCANELPLAKEGSDEEYLIYHGYCSRKCAGEDGYGNYVW
jgi:hypothetical protein